MASKNVVLYTTGEDMDEVQDFVDTSVMFENFEDAKSEAENLELKVYKITIEEVE